MGTALDELKSIRPLLELAVLTGDHRQSGERLAKSLQIKVLARLLPDEKQAIVKQYQGHGHVVAFVGEGYNDAPAMATADVGIALAAGADLTRDNASVCILGNDISAVPYMLELSRKTVRRIRRNLFWAFFYNVFGVMLASCGLLSPTMAAGIMFVSSVAVVAGPGRSSVQRPLSESTQFEKMEAVVS